MSGFEIEPETKVDRAGRCEGCGCDLGSLAVLRPCLVAPLLPILCNSLRNCTLFESAFFFLFPFLAPKFGCVSVSEQISRVFELDIYT